VAGCCILPQYTWKGGTMFKFLQSIIICAALVLSASVVADTLPLFIELCILGIAVLAAYAAYKLEDVK
tara:strand:+ start:1111 stop:1314 length:204 start_codon:yes stop_codon:yes gene_type:complete